MKKYLSRATKRLAVISGVCAAVTVVGIVLIIADLTDIGLGAALLGGMMSAVFLACFFGERSRWLTVDSEKIVLPRGALKDGKTALKRTVVELDRIVYVESKLHKGDKGITNDCLFHTLRLKDGTEITFTLYAYGKEAEKEIIETIKKSI